MHFAQNEPVALEAAQCLGEHFLRNPADLALQRRITPRPGSKYMNDERGPLIRDPAEDDPGQTLRVHDGSLLGAIWHASQSSPARATESDKPTGMYWPKKMFIYWIAKTPHFFLGIR